MALSSPNPLNPNQLLIPGTPQGDEKELNETDPVPNGQVVHFSCEYGYVEKNDVYKFLADLDFSFKVTYDK